MKNLWYFPQYYKQFSCKASQCRHSCCSSWRIPVSRREYEQLINMECTDELYTRVQRAFEMPDFPTDDCFRYICFNWLGECPIQDKGLCSIHREKGEAFLPKICRLYPRSLKQINQYNFASCSCSCEKVVELLFEPGATSITSGELDGEPELKYEVSGDDVALINLFQKIMQDNTLTLRESLYDICKIVNEKEFLYDYNRDSHPLSQALAVLKRLASSNSRLEEIVAPIIERYIVNPRLYVTDIMMFEDDFPDWEGFFNRVINNSMMYGCFPFVDKRFSNTLAYKGLCVCYGLLRVVCIGNYSFNPSKEGLVDAVSALFHLIDHTSFYYNVNVLTDNAAAMLKL